MTQIHCALCEKDLSVHGTPKYKTLFSIQVIDAESVLCRECAIKDQDISYKHYNDRRRINEEVDKRIATLPKQPRAYKIIGNIYLHV